MHLRKVEMGKRAAAVLAGLLLAAALAPAEDIYLKSRDKPVKLPIKFENPKGISVGKEFFPVEDIVDVYYSDVTPVTVRTGPYLGAFNAEKDSLDGSKEAQRKANLLTALQKYDDALAGFQKAGTAEKAVLRHLQFKIAMLKLRQANEDNVKSDALESLKSFVDRNPGTWQLVPALSALGRMQLTLKDTAGAEATYRKLAALDTTDEVKQDAELMAVQVLMSGGKLAEAQRELTSLKSKYTQGKTAARISVALASCLMEQKERDKAVSMLKQVVKESTDKSIKAYAHNALGMSLFKEGNYADARWEFLWVDVVYNQDREEHAKSLYHLWKISESLGETERAQRCRNELLEDRALAGTEYQRKGMSEKGS